MCGRDSKLGVKGILLLSALLLLASPVWSVGYLAELLGVRSMAGTSSQQSQELQAQPSQEMEETEMKTTDEVLESLQEEQLRLSEMSETELSQKLNNLLQALETKSIELDKLLATYDGSVESLKAQLESLKGAAQISDKMYDETLSSLNELAVKNTELADKNAYNEGFIAGLEKKEKQTKFFGNVGGVIGFKNSLPTWGITGNMGMKIGSGLMIGTGLSYMLGDFAKNPINLEWSLDNLSINATIGWEW